MTGALREMPDDSGMARARPIARRPITSLRQGLGDVAADRLGGLTMRRPRPSLPDLNPGGIADAAESLGRATFERGASYLLPEQERRRKALSRGLDIRGIPIGSELHSGETDDLRRAQGRDLENLALSSVAAGREEHGRLSDLALRQRGQLFDEATTERGQDASELAMLLSGLDPYESRRHETAMQRAGFGHESGMQRALFGHQGAMQRAGFGHESAMQRALFGHEGAMQRALFGHERGMAADDRAWKTSEAELGRVHQKYMQEQDLASKLEIESKRLEAAGQRQEAAQKHQEALQAANNAEALKRQLEAQTHEAGILGDTRKHDLIRALLGHEFDLEKLGLQHGHEKDLGKMTSDDRKRSDWLSGLFGLGSSILEGLF